jgi:hypothetical protein
MIIDKPFCVKIVRIDDTEGVVALCRGLRAVHSVLISFGCDKRILGDDKEIAKKEQYPLRSVVEAL